MSKKGLDDRPVSDYEEFALNVVRRASLASQTSVAASSSSLFGKVGFAQPKLEVEVEQDVLYLRPTIPDGPPGEDERLKGSVTLYLPKPRKLRTLVVRMIGRYDITWPDFRSPTYENGILSERKVDLLAENDPVDLNSGWHTFDFAFSVPANSATWERCLHGRVRYSVIGDAKLSASLTSSSSDLSSPPKTFYLVPNPGGPDADAPIPPPPLQLRTEGYFDDLGPWSSELQSQHITVGGLLLLRFSFPAPPLDTVLHSIKLSIFQTFFLTSPRPQKGSDFSTLQVKPAAHIVTILDSTHPQNSGEMQDDGRGAPRRNLDKHAKPLAVVRSGKGAEIVHLARLPNDNGLRPTTRIGTHTPIRIEHTLELEVLYRELVPRDEETVAERESRHKAKGRAKRKGKELAVEDEVPELKKLKIVKPLELFSCLNFVDALTLPAYEANDPNPVKGDQGFSSKVPCACGLTITELLDKHGASLLSSLRSPPSASSTSFPVLSSQNDSTTSTSSIKPGDARLTLSPSVSIGFVRRDSESTSQEREETLLAALERQSLEEGGEKTG